jgi:hypothetical protein
VDRHEVVGQLGQDSLRHGASAEVRTRTPLRSHGPDDEERPVLVELTPGVVDPLEES